MFAFLAKSKIYVDDLKKNLKVTEFEAVVSSQALFNKTAGKLGFKRYACVR